MLEYLKFIDFNHRHMVGHTDGFYKKKNGKKSRNLQKVAQKKLTRLATQTHPMRNPQIEKS